MFEDGQIDAEWKWPTFYYRIHLPFIYHIFFFLFSQWNHNHFLYVNFILCAARIRFSLFSMRYSIWAHFKSFCFAHNFLIACVHFPPKRISQFVFVEFLLFRTYLVFVSRPVYCIFGPMWISQTSSSSSFSSPKTPNGVEEIYRVDCRFFFSYILRIFFVMLVPVYSHQWGERSWRFYILNKCVFLFSSSDQGIDTAQHRGRTAEDAYEIVKSKMLMHKNNWENVDIDSWDSFTVERMFRSSDKRKKRTRRKKRQQIGKFRQSFFI